MKRKDKDRISLIPNNEINPLVKEMSRLLKDRHINVNVSVPICVRMSWGNGFRASIHEVDTWEHINTLESNVSKCSKVRKALSDFDRELHKLSNSIGKMARKYKVSKDKLFDVIQCRMYSMYK